MTMFMLGAVCSWTLTLLLFFRPLRTVVRRWMERRYSSGMRAGLSRRAAEARWLTCKACHCRLRQAGWYSRDDGEHDAPG